MIQSVDRALKLLTEVARRGEWVGVRELARSTGLTPPTAQNLLKTLQANEFLDFDDDTRRYRVGLAALRLAEAADPLERMADFARPYVERLFAEFGETVAVLTLVGDEAVVVDWRQGRHDLAVTHTRRVIGHSHFMASTQVLLAFQAEAFRRRYAEAEDYSEPGLNMPSSADELLASLTRVREQGVAETLNMRGSGVAAVSAPVLDGVGRIVMALACSMPISRQTPESKDRMRVRTVTTAREMSERLAGSSQM